MNLKKQIKKHLDQKSKNLIGVKYKKFLKNSCATAIEYYTLKWVSEYFHTYPTPEIVINIEASTKNADKPVVLQTGKGTKLNESGGAIKYSVPNRTVNFYTNK